MPYDATEPGSGLYQQSWILLDETLRATTETRSAAALKSPLVVQILSPKFSAGGRIEELDCRRCPDGARTGAVKTRCSQWTRDRNGYRTRHTENVSLQRQRWLLIERRPRACSQVYIGILVFWVTLMFPGFGFNAPRNATVVVGFLAVRWRSAAQSS